MKKILFVLCMTVSCITFANDIEVNGQFVIAPISSEKCEASAITAPTLGLSSDSPLFEMVTSFLTANDATSGIEKVVCDGFEQGEIAAIYSVDGKKLNELTRGINIVIDKQGNARKILVK